MRNDFTPRLQYTLAAVGIVGGVASLGYSIYKDAKASSADKKAAAEGASLKRPFEQVQPEYKENQNIARQEAAAPGLPIDVQNQLKSERDQQLGTSYTALQQAGASPNDYARINKLFDDSTRSEAGVAAQQHLQNIQYLAGVNKDIAGQKTTQWGVNEYQPFESKLKEIQDRRIAAQKNQDEAIAQGIGSLSSIGTNLYSAYGAGANGGGGGGNNYVLPSGTPVSIGAGGNPQDISLEQSGSGIDVANSVGSPQFSMPQ